MVSLGRLKIHVQPLFEFLDFCKTFQTILLEIKYNVHLVTPNQCVKIVCFYSYTLLLSQMREKTVCLEKNIRSLTEIRMVRLLVIICKDYMQSDKDYMYYTHKSSKSNPPNCASALSTAATTDW